MGNISLGKVYESLLKIEKSMVTRSEMYRFIETIEILSNSDTMKQIVESERDFKAGRIREINSVEDI